MKRRPNSSRGYTAIEVLMAMTVFAIGAAGIIGMQRASVQGNQDARNLDIANGIARMWIERLRRDASLWTTPAPPTDYTATNFLKSPFLDANAWTFPIGPCPSTSSLTSGRSNADGLCPAFDGFGRDLAQSDFALAAFCVNIRIDTVGKDQNNNIAVMRAMVRVYWPRGLVAAPYVNGGNRFCSAPALSDLTSGPDATTSDQIYHFVQSVTLISSNPTVQ
jgi:prepilin-type N-terminal cleavage/methylation domain-containing protein